jgi:CubicO group peptidase (beta-lactamase class C family)
MTRRWMVLGGGVLWGAFAGAVACNDDLASGTSTATGTGAATSGTSTGTSGTGTGTTTSGTGTGSSTGTGTGGGGMCVVNRAPTIAAAVDSATAGIVTTPQFVGLSVGVIDQGTNYTQYFGDATIGTPMSSTSILRIGSVSKTFTATLLGELAQSGAVSVGIQPGDPPETKVNDPVCTPPPSRAEITLGQLASHYSGLPDASTPPPNSENSAWLHFCNDSTANDNPGAYLYSNFGYDILGYDVVARMGQPTWEAAVQSTITDPLNMPDTRTLEQLDPTQLSRVAEDYDYTNNMITADTSNPIPLGDYPAGALFSTLPDQMTWLAFNMRDGNTNCAPSDTVCQLSLTLPLLRTPRGPADPNTQIALAWGIRDLTGCGDLYYFKGGAIGSYRAFIAYTLVPEKRGVVVMFNYSLDASVMENLVSKLLKTIP